MDKILLFYVMLLSVLVIYIIYTIPKVKENINLTKITNDSTCSATNCKDVGVQKRLVKCYDPDYNTPLPDGSCSNLTAPTNTQLCMNRNCRDWKVDPWSSACSLCRQPTDNSRPVSTVSRNVYCPSSDPTNCNQDLYDSKTNPKGKPSETMTCPDTICSALSGHYIITNPVDTIPFQGFRYESGNINNVNVMIDTIYFPVGLSGNFLLSIIWYGKGEVSSNTYIPYVKYSNISLVKYFNAGNKSSINNQLSEGSLGNTLFFMVTFTIIDQGTPSSISFDKGFLLPLRTKSADLFLTKLNDNVDILCNPCDKKIGNLPLMTYYQILTPTEDNLFGGSKLIFDSIDISMSRDVSSDFPVQNLIIPYSNSKFLFIFQMSGTTRVFSPVVEYVNISRKICFNNNTVKDNVSEPDFNTVSLYMSVITLRGPSDGIIKFYSGSVPTGAICDIFLIQLDETF